MTPTFQGEVQLRRWSESSTQGVQVTFALADSDELGPLKIKSGKRFACVLVEIGDDEKPVQYPPGAVVPADKSMTPTVGPLAYWLVMRCKEPEFWAWLNYEGWPSNVDVTSSEMAGDVVKKILGVESRKDVDSDPEAETRFHVAIRQPYQKWLVRRSG